MIQSERFSTWFAMAWYGGLGGTRAGWFVTYGTCACLSVRCRLVAESRSKNAKHG